MRRWTRCAESVRNNWSLNTARVHSNCNSRGACASSALRADSVNSVGIRRRCVTCLIHSFTLICARCVSSNSAQSRSTKWRSCGVSAMSASGSTAMRCAVSLVTWGHDTVGEVSLACVTCLTAISSKCRSCAHLLSQLNTRGTVDWWHTTRVKLWSKR